MGGSIIMAWASALHENKYSQTNIYATSLPANLLDTTVAVAVWARLAIRCYRWSGKERVNHVCGQSLVRTCGMTELRPL